VGGAVAKAGVAVVGMIVGAKAGPKGGGIGKGPPASPNAYSVAFETTIPKQGIGTRPAHFAAANSSLRAAIQASPELAQAMQKLGIEVPVSSGGGVKSISPNGWTWHHVPDQPGVMQLVPRSQHTTASPFYYVLHPDGRGGFFFWGQAY